MRLGRPLTPFVLTTNERSTLDAWSRRRTTAQALALRARIVLQAADGQSNTVIAHRERVTRTTVGKWRGRFLEKRLDGLIDEPRPGVPRQITDADVERVITVTLESTPRDATHWSTRSLAAYTDMSQSAIARIWKAFGLQPHRTETFKLSTDPLLIEKVRDIVGLYMQPPTRAVGIVPAWDRSVASLTAGGGRVRAFPMASRPAPPAAGRRRCRRRAGRGRCRPAPDEPGRVDRMRDAVQAPKPKSPDFERPADFDVKSYAQRSPWTFTIEPPEEVQLAITAEAAEIANEDFGLTSVKRQAANGPEAAVKLLLQGITAAERKKGYGSAIPNGVTLTSAEVDDEKVELEFSTNFAAADMSYLARVAQVVYTATGADSDIEEVEIRGRTFTRADFAPPDEYAAPKPPTKKPSAPSVSSRRCSRWHGRTVSSTRARCASSASSRAPGASIPTA